MVAAIGSVVVGAAAVGVVAVRAGEPPAPIYSTPLGPTNQFGTSGDDQVTGSGVARNGDLYLGGMTTGQLGLANAGLADAFIAKYDKSGNRKWVQQFGSTFDESVTAIAVSAAGDTYLVGSTAGDIDGAGAITQVGGTDAFIAKYDRNGNRKWVRQLGTTAWDILTGVAVGSDGSVYACGQTDGDIDGSGPAVSVGLTDGFVVKYDRNGNRKWARQVGSTEGDYPAGVAVRSSGDLVVVGSTDGGIAEPSGGKDDLTVTRYDKNGNLKWTHQYGAADREVGYSAAWGPTGEIFVTGYTDGAFFGAGGLGGGDLFLAHLGPTGAMVKSVAFGSAGYEDVPSMVINRQGTIFLHGMTSGSMPGFTSAGSDDQWVARFNSSLDLAWLRQFGTTESDTGAWVMPISLVGSSSLLIGGATKGSIFGHSNAGGDDAFFSIFPVA